MVIVAGHVMVEPDQREAYLAGSLRIVEKARPAAGCLDVSIAADLIDPGRVNIFERWESQKALDTFRRRGGTGNVKLPKMLSASVLEYDVAAERPAFGKANN
ncbi:putative quinol monooxygenase [Antrihabitans sp. YC2-6]|uniref:putative quinol monooxygenase n=1 Tax=Antrihabitans sp. YC2-6 TaxID=2799498 RepID=UPI0018F5DD9A|nr:antibiotic biosynthesis monooxygenase [Antrihabitans sp. YC2-6]MBJ8344353.1 antibiotic biosynthesis monooxygenase [Antrihabitans sp. YC2-6]